MESIYRAAGETPPPAAKPNIDGDAIHKYLQGLSDREFQVVSNLSGVRFLRHTAETPTRNAACPCGSGLKYKHCHGTM